MAATAKAIDNSQAYDPKGPCPVCKEEVQMYLPPERSIGGPIAYPALLLHFEQKHPRVAPPTPPMVDELTSDEITGRMVRTGNKVVESWETQPPAPEDWRPADIRLAGQQLAQPAGVWPPVRIAKQPQ